MRPDPDPVAVFGATGSIGRLVVARLLDDGHAVTAFARHPGRLDLAHPRLRPLAGDAGDPEAVARALDGHGAAIVTLGAGAALGSRIRSEGTLNVIRGMQRHGARRLIVQTTLGARESWSNLDFWWKRVMFGALLRPVFCDHELQERLVEASGLDWTIVRPSAFTDRAPAGQVRTGFGPGERGLALKIARADVAAFLVRQLAETAWIQRAVGIST
jgi:uncharacterized protein YbjT (DUF2867 family)